jgi:hypothetical protein
MRTNSEHPKTTTYLLLLAIQVVGAITFIWQELPDFGQLLRRPGQQLPEDAYSDLIVLGVFCAMQISFWCRLLYVPIPFRRSNPFLNHVFYFWGASVSFLAAPCSLSSFSGTFLNWGERPMSCWRPNAE